MTETVARFDPVFDADTGWAFAVGRAAEVHARWRRDGLECKMRGCDRRAVDLVCRGHLDRVDRRWVPVARRDGELFCGLCATPVMLLWQNDMPRDRQWIIESVGNSDGRLRVEEGGFTVLSVEQARQHRTWRDSAPLYRAHPAACPKIRTLAAAGHLVWVENTSE